MWPNPQFPADLVTFREEISNGKLHFLCSDVWDWFVDNKLSVYFGEDKAKCIHFSRDKNLPELNIYNNNRIKQYRMVEYLGCYLDANIGQKSISFIGPSIWNKLSNNLKVLNTTTSFTHNYKKLVLQSLSE